jgi:UDP-2,3-diacylglucosamine pyrophosphatase LpxH
LRIEATTISTCSLDRIRKEFAVLYWLFHNDATKPIARDAARKLAEKYGGKGKSKQAFKADFDHMWDLTWKAKGYAEQNHDAMKATVLSNLNRLGAIAAGITATTGISRIETAPAGAQDLQTWRAVPASGRHVVFSDIHITDRGNRQDFFETYNKALYLDVLRHYYAPNDWTLIENGDVEELLVFEPDRTTMPDFDAASWGAIIADRAARKRAQFLRIIDDHADYYRTVHDHFIARGAYYRTIGNHDYDLASADYADEIESRLGLTWPRATDMVGLCRGGSCEMLICHGHQFDAFCVAGHAEKAGESFSQGGAWAYQGPDRHWTEDKDGRDFITPWREGRRAFANMLVSDDPGAPVTEASLTEALAGQAIGNLHDPDKWEIIYGKNIAWDYFIHDDPQDAFDDEVSTGERWYKFRHMDEFTITDRLKTQFPDGGMTLLLGHSHEPRIRAGGRLQTTGGLPRVETVSGYVNSAAAGRFDNLIWGIEIDNGVPTVVSWSRDAGSGRMIRAVWEDRVQGGIAHVLEAVAWTEHEAVSPPADTEEQRPSIVAAITHLLFA